MKFYDCVTAPSPPRVRIFLLRRVLPWRPYRLICGTANNSPRALNPDCMVPVLELDSGAAIRAVCSQFVVLCRELGLFTRAVVAIDGSKFKAVNNRDKNYTVAKVTGRMEQVDASIARYLRALDQADREESDIARPSRFG